MKHCTSLFPEFEKYYREAGWDVGSCEGAIFIGSMRHDRFISRVKGPGGKGALTCPPAEVNILCGVQIYEIIHADGMNFRQHLPDPKNYNASTYREIPIKFHLKKGCRIVLLAGPYKISATDYWAIAGTQEHPLFDFKGDVETYLKGLSDPGV